VTFTPAGSAASCTDSCASRFDPGTVVSLAAAETIRQEPRHYLNRLSDLLFVLARVLNRANLDGLGGDDVYWKSERLAREGDAG
jgi:cob(I)alamin adenosyltransferase